MVQEATAVSETTSNTETVGTDNQPANEGPLFNDPFDFSDGKQEPLESKLSFDLDDDGEVQISGFESEEDKEQEASSEESSEQQEESGISQPPIPQENPFEVSEREAKLAEQNKILEDRIAKLENRFSSVDSEKQKEQLLSERRQKLEDAGFTDEQIEVILDISGTPQVEASEEKDGKEAEEDRKTNEERLNFEVAEVIKTYDGQEGRPSVQEMKPFVDYAYMRFGENVSKYPMKSIFKLAENAPFIQWLDNNHSDRMKGLTIPQVFQVSENLKTRYYQTLKEKGHKFTPFDHLRQNSQNGQETKGEQTGQDGRQNNNLSNDEIIRLSREQNEVSRNVPGGEVETEEEQRERMRPKDARSVASATINALYGEA